MAVKLGFVGCGSHARGNLYPCLRLADCELVAVADLWEVHRAFCMRHFGAHRGYDDYGKLLDNERELDAVIVCGPPELHHAASLAALQRGLHVLCEKPPGMALSNAIEMREASRRANKTLMVAFMKRFAQKYVIAKQIASSPAFGGIRHCHIKYSFSAGSDVRTTATMESIHAIDLMRHFMGDPLRISIERSESDGRTSLQLLYRFESGSTGTLVMNAGWPYVSERVELCGVNEAVVVDEVATLTHYRGGDSSAWKAPVGEVRANNFALQTDENSSAFLQGYAGEIIEFIESVKANRRPVMATIDDAVEAMRMVELLVEKPFGTHEWSLTGSER